MRLPAAPKGARVARGADCSSRPGRGAGDSSPQSRPSGSRRVILRRAAASRSAEEPSMSSTGPPRAKSAARSCSSTAPPATRPTCSSLSQKASPAGAFACSASTGRATAGATGSAAEPPRHPCFRPMRCGGRRRSSASREPSSPPIRSARSPGSRWRSTIRSSSEPWSLIAPVSHPWPGGVAWYYSIGAHRLFGPPFRRLLALPIGMGWMASAVASVFAPNPAPGGFHRSDSAAPRAEAPSLPRQLRGRRLRRGRGRRAIAALRADPRADGSGHRRLGRRRLCAYPLRGIGARHPRRAADDARRAWGTRPITPRPDRVAETLLEAERRAPRRASPSSRRHRHLKALAQEAEQRIVQAAPQSAARSAPPAAPGGRPWPAGRSTLCGSWPPFPACGSCERSVPDRRQRRVVEGRCVGLGASPAR